MDISQAISNFLSQDRNHSSTSLSDVIEQILQLGSKKESTDTAAEQMAVFEQLATAARSGQQEIFQELVKAEQQQATPQEPTLLMAAVMAEQLEVVQALVAAGADVNKKIQQFFEFNALDFAIDKENIAITQTLLAAGADPNWSNASPGLASITKAVKKQNVQLVQLLLEYSASVRFETRFQLIVEAAQYDNIEIIQLLLDAGCDPNAVDHNGSALKQACLHCNVGVIQALLAAGAQISKVSSELFDIFSAPFLAKQMSGLLGKQPDPTPKIPLALQTLIDAGANVNTRLRGNITALTVAVTEDSLDVVQLLLAAGADPNLPGQISGMMLFYKPNLQPLIRQYSGMTTPLHVAVVFGRVEIAQVLIAAGAAVDSLDDQGRSPIAIAIKEGHQQIVQILSGAGATAPTTATQLSADALLGAAKKGNLETLRAALEAGVDPNTSEPSAGRNRKDKTALMFAAEGGHLEAVQMLLAAGADVNLSDRPGKKLGKTPLMYAAEEDQAEVAQCLLEAGAIVDFQNKRGETALFYAVQEKAAKAVKVLLAFGADPHKQGWDGTPFESATYSSKTIAKLIMAADQQKTQPQSNTAREEMLRSAAFDQNPELVRDLIQQGVNVNAGDRNGWTALIYAAAKGDLTMVQLLLAAGAEVNLAATSGQTALTEATYWGHAEVVDVLISAGA